MPSFFMRSQDFFKSDATGGTAARKGRGATILRRLARGRGRPDLDHLAQRVILPALPVTDEDMARLELWTRGRQLARQDRWDRLADQIGLADDARLATPGGVSEAVLLATGAQSDVVAAASDALADDAHPDPAGIAAMEEVLSEEGGTSHAIAMVLALAHINIGRAWMLAAASDFASTSRHRAHFDRAGALLARHDAVDLDAPSLAAVQCSLAEITKPESAAVIAAYHRLLALDPHSPAHLRAFGLALQHTQANDTSLLEREARDIAAQTSDIWGNGAYVWTYLDVLAQSHAALGTLDVDLFTAGLRDILVRKPDQHIVNELAAFCAISMAPRDSSATKETARTRVRLHGCLDGILTGNLQELHPLIWSEVRQPSASPPREIVPRALVAQGRQRALRVIAGRFADQLADGSSLAFSSAGVYRLPSL